MKTFNKAIGSLLPDLNELEILATNLLQLPCHFWQWPMLAVHPPL
jgi:hypothetical protein